MKRLARRARAWVALPPLALALSFLMAACSSEDGPDGALERALAHTRPMPLLATRAPASGATGAATDAEGPRTRTTVRAELRLDVPEHAQRVTWTRTLDRQGAAYRFTDARGWERPSVFADPAYRAAAAPLASPPPRRDDDHLEVLYDGTRLAMRHAAGPWIAREVLDGLPARLLAQANDLADLALRGFGDYLQWEPAAPDAEHPATLAGRPVVWSTARLDAGVAPVDATDEELASWRDHLGHWRTWLAATHIPTRITGRIARADAQASEVLAADLLIEGTAHVEGVEAPFAFHLEQALEPLPPDANFDWPADVMPAARPRPWYMIREVLGDALAPIYAGDTFREGRDAAAHKPAPAQKNVPTPSPK